MRMIYKRTGRQALPLWRVCNHVGDLFSATRNYFESRPVFPFHFQLTSGNNMILNACVTVPEDGMFSIAELAFPIVCHFIRRCFLD